MMLMLMTQWPDHNGNSKPGEGGQMRQPCGSEMVRSDSGDGVMVGMVPMMMTTVTGINLLKFEDQ